MCKDIKSNPSTESTLTEELIEAAKGIDACAQIDVEKLTAVMKAHGLD